MEPSFRVGLGRPVEHMLQCADPVPLDSRQGGPSRISGTHQSGPPSLRVNEAAALPSPQVVLSCRSDRYYGRLRLPPGAPPASRLLTGYRTRPSAGTAARSGRGGPPQFPPSPSERSAPSTPDSPSRLRFQDLHRFHGLRRDYRGSALSCRALTTRQVSLDATDHSVAPLLLKGFRRWAPARPVSRPSRQPATGLPGDYPDRTFTGRRRRASDQVMIAGQPPPDALGARNFGLELIPGRIVPGPRLRTSADQLGRLLSQAVHWPERTWAAGGAARAAMTRRGEPMGTPWCAGPVPLQNSSHGV